jgi:hypothetical protein
MRLLIAAAGLAAVLLVPSSASADIVPQRSIMGIELQMTRAQVEAVAGKPDRVRTRPHEIIGSVRVLTYGRTRVTLARRSGVIDVTTRDPFERTSRDVGVGTHRSLVRKRVAGARCRDQSGFRHCLVGRLRPGRTVTLFRLNKRNRVTSVSIGAVID